VIEGEKGAKIDATKKELIEILCALSSRRKGTASESGAKVYIT
jgi:hypothetical protein